MCDDRRATGLGCGRRVRCACRGLVFIPWLACLLAVFPGCTRTQDETEFDRAALFASSTDETQADETQADDGDPWLRALHPRKFAFPKDHAAHEDFRIEWWYYTGNLVSKDGRQFGYQLTFFRTGLRKDPDNPSAWAVRDLYTAHFGLSDIKNGKHYCLQQTSRAGVGLAGAEADSYRVWNRGWTAKLDGDMHHISAARDDVELDLRLTPSKPIVLHGENGLSRKGPTPGNASYYYSVTRMASSGVLRIGGEEFQVTGNSWMDHEFSTSFLELRQVGWDWFSLQLDDGVDIMLYQIRLADGQVEPNSSGTVVDPAGQMQHLGVGEYRLSPGGTWTSRDTSARYPLEWRVEIPELGYDLLVKPKFQAQEMVTRKTTGISYWEGAMTVEGRHKDRGAVTGHGYMELTGYVGKGLGTLFEE